MKATEASLLQFLKKSPQFVIPIYQRTYSWTDKECLELWTDLLRAGSDDDIKAHFVGSVVYVEEGLYQVSSQSPLLVIDGQQRLTTVSLVLEALCRHLDGEPVDGFSARKIRNYYLLNPEEDGEKAYKLLLTQTDRESLKALVKQQPMPDEHSLRIAENFGLFDRLVTDLKGDLAALCRGLSKLVVVDVALSRAQDNPQLIFESMNSTGRELSQADLIRNFVLMGLEPTHQTALYEQHWRPMERGFGQEGYGTYFDAFMRHYLTVKTGDIPNVKAVYEAFKTYSRQGAIADAGVDALVAEVHQFAGHYCAMALGLEKDPDLAEAFHDLRELKVEVAYPILLELYHAYAAQKLTKADFLSAIRFIESYVFRRAVCAIPTNSMNKTFATIGRTLNQESYLRDLQVVLLTLPSYRRFPSDDEFKRELASRDLYNQPRRSYWLRRMETDGRKEKVFVEAYTIEHIMPQNPDLSAEWQAALGPDWEQVHARKLHTLGNLTLTGYNSEYSDHPFPAKRDMVGGFKESPLRLNKGLGAVAVWNEAAIDARAHELAEKAVAIWQRPPLPPGVSIPRRGIQASSTSVYTLADHPQLAVGRPARALFDLLRPQLLDLDPTVTEEVKKLYIAFKAETNFVDIVPQANRLRLALNMPFPEIRDPRGLAKDVTNIGRWGNGDVEVRLTNAADLPYIMGLIRQALERQLETSSLQLDLPAAGA